MSSRLLTFLTFFFFANTVFAQQVYPVSLTGLLIPPHSLDLSVYGTQRAQDLIFTAALTDPIEPYRDTRLKLYIENNGQTLYTTDPNYGFPTLRLNMNQPVNLDGFALQPYLQPEALIGAAGQGQGSVIVPEGLNRICLEVIDLERNVPISRKTCVTGGFFLNEPPILQMPACGGNVPQSDFLNQTFAWTPLHLGSGNSPAPVEYLFQLVELPPGVDANDGFDFSLKIMERTTVSPSLIYGPTDPILQPGHIYAWRVQARNMLKPGLIFRNYGKSQVCTFVYGDGFAPFGGSQAAEQMEEDRVAPQGCQVFDTDFGPIFTQDYTPVPLAEGDVVKIGWFEMTVADATPSGNGYSGSGFVKMPMLNTHVLVKFTNLKAKPNTLRCYEAGSIEAVCDNQVYLDPATLSEATMGSRFTPQFFQNLKNWFTDGQGQNRLVSRMDPNVAAQLPIGLDKQGSPLVAITGIRFTPRNCYLTAASYTVASAGKTMSYAGLNIEIVPNGVRNNSFLSPLNGSANQVFAQIFKLEYKAGPNSVGMGVDCAGFAGYELQTEFSIDPEIMVLANGGGPVKFGLEDEGSEPGTYLGKVKKFDDFTLPKLPGFLFSMKNGTLDLNENQKIEQAKLAAAQTEAWRGLYLGTAEVTLPIEYDFTGIGKAITLDQGGLALDAQGGYGHFSKTNVISLDKGRIGGWRYSVDSISLNIVNGAAQNTRLAGQLQVPVLDEPFHYAGELKINGDDARLTISPQPGQRGMSLWNAKLDIEPDAKVDAVLRDFGPQGKKFMPDADLNGMFSMDFSSKQFEDRLVGNKGIIKSRLKQIFGYSLNAAPSFQLKDLKLEHLTIDPTQLPDDRYKLGNFQAHPDGLSIGGTKAQVAEVRLKYSEDDGQGNQELGFEVVVRKGTNLVQFTFFAKTNPQTGEFQFDRIEVKTEEVECDCHAYVPHNEVYPSDMGQMLERVYDNYLAPQKIQPSSGLAGGNALDLAGANTELLAAYKQATIAELQENMVGGFPVLGDNEIVIPFFNKNNGGLKVACMKNGTEYTALTHPGFTRSGTNFDYNHLLNHLPAPTNGVWKLPLDVTDSLNLMGFERTDFPENTRLLITGIRLTGNSDVKSASKALFDFTLVAKIDDKTDAVFVKTDVEVGPTSVSGKNFYLYLDEDVSLNSPGVFNSKAGNKTLKLKASQPEAGREVSSENHSYAFMTCTEGFKTFNVQGEYAVPFDSGRLKVRDLGTNKAEDALKSLNFGFVIHNHKAPLTEFIAAIKEKTTEGDPLRFVVDGEEGLVFTAEKKIDAYLDFNASENDLAHMPDAPADFMGLYFEEIEIAIEGIDTTGGPYKADARNYYFLPGNADEGKNGMVGKFEKNGSVIKYEDGLKIGGWNYGLDTLSINFTDANSDAQGGNACYISGQTHCPIFKEFYDSKPELMGFSGMLKWEKGEATVSGEEGTSVIQPVADFSLGKKNEFQASWLPGMVVMLDEESTLSFEWNFEGNSDKGGFLPVAEMNGKAMVFFTKKLAGQMEGGSEEVNSWGIDFGLPGLQFEGMSVNKGPEEDAAPDDPETVDIKDPAIGLKYLCLGEWGFGLEGLLGEKDDPKNEEERNEDRAEKRKEIREHLAKNGGMNGFPLSIDKPTFGVTNKAEIFMELAITVNLLQEKLAEGTKTNKKLVNQIEKDGSSSKVNSTGIVATTVLRFYSKMVKGKGVLPDRVGLQQIAVAGAFGPVEIAGALQFLKAETPAEEEWGEGFKAYCDFRFGKSPDGSYKFQAKAMTQFGAVTRATENGGKKYRYFFADLEAGLPAPGRHLSYGIFLVGVGGGIYVNMEKQSPATYEAPGEAEEEEEDLIETSTDGMFKAIDDELMKPGRSLSGFEYKPKYQSYGGYFKGIFDWVSPKQMLFDIAVGIEVGFNTAGKFCFKKVFAKGDAYVFADNMADRAAAPIKASAEIEVDIANGQISAAANMSANYEMKGGLLKLTIDPANARAAMLIQFKKGGKRYFKAGKPGAPVSAELFVFGTTYKVGQYFQVGSDLDPVPDISEMVEGWPESGKPERKGLDPENGLCLGMGMEMQVSKTLGIFFATLRGGFGFDLGIGSTTMMCGVPPRQLGFNGWRVKGQVYAYASAAVGMEYDLGFTDGRVNILEAFLGMQLKGQFPNPSVFEGRLAGRFSVLGGMVKGKFNMNFEVVSKKDRECLEFLNANQNNLVADLKIVGDKYPANEATKVPIFVKPKLAFNLDVGKEMALEDEDINGNKRLRYFRANFHPTEGHNLWKGKQKIACRATVDPESATLEPAQFLSPYTAYVFKYKLKWEEKLNGKWTDLKDAAGKPVVEEDSMSFTTGKLPDKIVTELLDYHAPGYRQRYWHTGFAKPTVKFKSTVDGVSWEEAYFPTHSPDTAHIPGYGKIAYDYVVKLTKYKQGQEEGGYELPLSEYPGLVNFQIPVPVSSQIGNNFLLKRMELRNVSGLNVSYAGLNDLINTASEEWKNRLVRLEIVRVPILPKAQTTDETEKMVGDDGIEINIPKRSLVSDESKIPVQHGTKILYEYWFSTSQYANLADKLMASTATRYNHSAYRNEYKHPDDTLNYYFFTNFNFEGRQSFYNFRDDFFGFQNSFERFDTFDLTRIYLNAGIKYEKPYGLKKQYDEVLAQLPYKWANSVYLNKFKVGLTSVGNKEVDLTGSFSSWKNLTNSISSATSLNSQLLKDLLGYFASMSVLGEATGFAGYDKAGKITNYLNDQWSNNLFLPTDQLNTLQQSEIDGKKLTAGSYQGVNVPGDKYGKFSTPTSYGLMFRNSLSSITGLQVFTLKEVMERGFASRVKAEYIDKWSGLTEAEKNIWASSYWKFFAPANAATSQDYTSLNTAYGNLRQKIAQAQYASNMGEKNADNLAYNDGILFSFPKVANWSGMNQRVNPDNFQRFEVMLKPSRETSFSVSSPAPTLASAANPGVAMFHQTTANYDLFMQSFPKDEKINSIEIGYQQGGAQPFYKTKCFWDVQRREADLYDKDGKRVILFNVELSDGMLLNLSELLQLAGTNWAKPIKDSALVRVYVQTDKGSYGFGGPRNGYDGSLPGYKLRPWASFENGAATSFRKSAYLFRRGAGSRANDITMDLVGSGAIYDFGGCLLVDPAARQIVAYISPDRKLTRYYYTEKGCSQITSDYQMGSPIATLDPTREYKLFAAKRYDSHFKAVAKLDKDFWDEKMGRFFDDSSFDTLKFDVAVAPAVLNNGGKTFKVPGERFEAEDYARPNIVKALEVWGKPEYAGEGFAFHDSSSDGTMIYAECSGCLQTYLNGAGVDLMKEFDQNQSNARAVSLVAKGEWLTYKVNVEKDDNYTLKFGYSAMQQRGRIAFELDGAVMLDTMLNTTANSPKRYNKLSTTSPQYHFIEFLVEKLRLPQGEHTLKIRFFDNNLSLDYLKFEVMKPKASIKVKASGLQILDGNTNLGNPSSTHDFGNVACNATSQPVEFTLKNEGNATLVLQGSPLVHLDNTADFEVVRSPAAQIMPDSSTIFSIRFKPKSTNVGLRKATVTIRSNDADPTAQEFTFRVQATNNPVEAEVRAGSEMVESSQTAPGLGSPGYFGVVLPGQRETATFVLHNFGNAEMTSITWEMQGPAAADFSVSNTTSRLGIGEGHSFSVSYTGRQGAGGPQLAYLSINTGDCDENPYFLPLAAVGTAPELDVKLFSNSVKSGEVIDLGEINSDTAKIEVNIANLGVEPLSINSFNLTSNDPANSDGRFILTSNALQSSMILGQGNNMNLPLIYVPNRTSTFTNSATLTIANSDSDEGNFKVILTGKSGQPAIRVKHDADIASGQIMELQAASVGNTQANSFSISNKGRGTLKISGITISGHDAMDFKIPLSMPLELKPGEEREIPLIFTPVGQNYNIRRALVTIQSNDLNQLKYLLELRATANPPGDGPGRSLAFDGTDDAVNLGMANTYLLKNLTVEFWVKPTDFFTKRTVVSKGSKNSFSLAFNPSGVLVYESGNSSASDVLPLTTNIPASQWLNKWTHVAVVRNDASKTVSCYVNGQMVTTESGLPYTKPIYNSTLPITIGRNAAFPATEFFKGNIDELRIWEKALTANEIQSHKDCELSGNETGLVAYFPFNQGIGNANNSNENSLTARKGAPGTLQNFALTGNSSNWSGATGIAPDATVCAGSPLAQADPNTQGNKNRALAFGGNTYVDCGNPEAVQITGSTITLEAWVKYNNRNGDFSIIDKTSADPGNTGYALRYGAGYASFYIKKNGVKYEVKVTSGLVVDRWQHLAGVYDGKRMKFYVDGSLKATSELAFGEIKDSGSSLWLGNDPSSASQKPGFAGAIDEVRIWKRALSSDEIAARSNCELYGSEPGLAAWYSFNQGIPDDYNQSENMLFLSGGTGSNGSLHGFLLEPYYDTQNTRTYVANWTKGKETVATCPVNAGVAAIGLQGGPSEATILENTSPVETNGTYIGAVSVGAFSDAHFTIVSKGNGPLTLPDNAVKISGDHASDFKLIAQPVTGAIAVNGTKNFTVRFTPSANPGIRNAVVTVASDDPLKPFFAYNIQGIGVKSSGMEVKKSLGNTLVPNIASGSTAGAVLDFGSVVLGDSVQIPFIIKNTASGSVLALTGTGNKVVLSGTNASNFEVTRQPAASINANGTEVFVISYRPSASGLHDEVTVSIASNDPANKNYSFKIKGNCLFPNIALLDGNSSILDQADPATASTIGLDFGESKTKITRTLQVSNRGDGKLDVSSIAISGAHAARFSVSKSKLPSLAPQCLNCEAFDLSFDPVGLTDLDQKTAVVSIVNNGAGASKSFEFKLAGRLKAPAISVSGKGGVAIANGIQYEPVAANGTDFGKVRAENYAKQSFTVRNTGSEKLVISHKPQLQGDPGFSFSTLEPGISIQPDTFTVRSLQPGQSLTFWLGFFPSSAEGSDRSAIVSIKTNGVNAKEFQFKLKASIVAPKLVIRGGSPPVAIQNNPTAKAKRENHTQFEDSPTRTFRMENTGDDNLIISKVYLEGIDQSAFTLESLPLPLTLASKETKDFSVNLFSRVGAVRNAVVVIEMSNTAGLAGIPTNFKYKFAIQGETRGPKLELRNGQQVFSDTTVVSADFGNVPIGTTKDLKFTIANTGNAPLSLYAKPVIVVSEGHPSMGRFDVTPNFTTSSVPAGGSANFTLRFTPALQSGICEENFSIPNDGSTNGSIKVKIRANVIAPEIELLVGETVLNNGYNFGAFKDGAGTLQSFTIANTGNAELRLNGTPRISLTGDGTAYGQFSIPMDVSAASIPAGGTATFSVQFKPVQQSGDNSRSVKLIIPCNDPDEAQFEMNLMGTLAVPEIFLFGENFSQLTDRYYINGAPNYSKGLKNLFGGTGSETNDFTFVNSGLTEGLISNIGITGPGASAFRVDKTSLTIPPKTSDTFGEGRFRVSFNPVATDVDYKADLVFYSNEPGRTTLTIPLKGNKPSPRAKMEVRINQQEAYMALESDAVNYYSVDLSKSNKTQAIYIANGAIVNNANTNLVISDITITGPNADAFSITGSKSFTVAPGSYKSFTVNFNKTTVGDYYATIKIVSSDPDFKDKVLKIRGKVTPWD